MIFNFYPDNVKYVIIFSSHQEEPMVNITWQPSVVEFLCPVRKCSTKVEMLANERGSLHHDLFSHPELSLSASFSQERSEWSHWKWRFRAPCLPSSRRCWRTLRDWRAMEPGEGKEEKAQEQAEKRTKQSSGAVIQVRHPNRSPLPARAPRPAPLLLPLPPAEGLHSAAPLHAAPPCAWKKSTHTADWKQKNTAPL